jgi:hypothetical protein
MNYPSLIDYNSIQYLTNTLQSCHEKRITIYYYVLNIGIFALFCIIFGSALYFCYKNKPTPYEKHQKILKDQEFILSKIRFHQDNHNLQQNQMSNITNLPFINS